MLRTVPHTGPRGGRSYEHFPDGFEIHLLHGGGRREAREGEGLVAEQGVSHPSNTRWRPERAPRMGDTLKFKEILHTSAS